MVTDFSFVNSYNDELLGNKREIANPLAKIILVTGMCEHSLRYDAFATFLNSRGFSVYSLDHYGQGKNGKPLGNPGKDYFFKMIDTIKELSLYLKEDNDAPVYIFSHSMGSFVTQGVIERYSNYFEKIVLCGSNGKTFLFKVASFAANLLVHKWNYNKKAKLLHNLSIGSYEKKFASEGDSDAWLSVSTENIKRYKEDPYAGYVPTNGFYKEFFKGLASLHNRHNLKRVNQELKVLIVGGSDDPVGNFAKGLRKLEKEYKSYGIKTSIYIYEGLRHEIINEDDVENRFNVYSHIADFYEGK